MSNEIVELRPAYAWDCPDCGIEHFTRAIVPEMSPEDFEKLKEDNGIPSWEMGNFQMMPDTVQCNECKKIFETEGF